MPVVPAVIPALPDEPVFPISVERYHAMIDAGVLTDDDPVELLEGVLVFRMPKKPSHRLKNQQLARLFRTTVPPGWFYQSQEPITLADGEPEPDGAVVRGREEDYADRHPGPADVALVIEVADTTLQRDRGIKLRSYARAGIQHYWIINLVDRSLEVYSGPLAAAPTPTYRDRIVLTRGARIELPLDAAGVDPIDVGQLLD